MAGRPKTRARREAAERAAAGLPPLAPAPSVFVGAVPQGAEQPTVDDVMSRPQKRIVFSEEIAEKIATLIALRVPVARICEQPEFPCETTLFRWRREHKEFDEMIRIARQHRAEARTDRIDEIIEDVRRGKLDPIAARMIFDAERWLAGREHSVRYADSSTQRVEMSGPGGAPISIQNDPTQMREVARFFAFVCQRAAAATGSELLPEAGRVIEGTLAVG